MLTIVNYFFPNFIPYNIIDDFWSTKGSIIEWYVTSKYLFFWAIFWGLFGMIKSFINNESYHTFNEIIQSGVLKSLYAGITEEILFRWLLFLGSMIALYISNWILGGFLGSNFGLIQWIHNTIEAPVSNWVTFGYLKNQIFHTHWYTGAAIISTNVLFRDGHKYQGLFGTINSWFGGMFLFYIMFKFGLIPAIIIHASYNMTLYIFAAFTSLIKTIAR